MRLDEAYGILGIEPGVSQELVKKARNRKAREHHTDKGGVKSAMQNVNLAYEKILASEFGRVNQCQKESESDKMILEIIRGNDRKLEILRIQVSRIKAKTELLILVRNINTFENDFGKQLLEVLKACGDEARIVDACVKSLIGLGIFNISNNGPHYKGEALQLLQGSLKHQKKLVESMIEYKDAADYISAAIKYVDTPLQEILVKDLSRYKDAAGAVGKAFEGVVDTDIQLELAKELSRYKTNTREHNIVALGFATDEKARKVLIDDFLRHKTLKVDILKAAFQVVHEEEGQGRILERVPERELDSFLPILNTLHRKTQETFLDRILSKKSLQQKTVFPLVTVLNNLSPEVISVLNASGRIGEKTQQWQKGVEKDKSQYDDKLSGVRQAMSLLRNENASIDVDSLKKQQAQLILDLALLQKEGEVIAARCSQYREYTESFIMNLGTVFSKKRGKTMTRHKKSLDRHAQEGEEHNVIIRDVTEQLEQTNAKLRQYSSNIQTLKDLSRKHKRIQEKIDIEIGKMEALLSLIQKI